jgi:archaeal flagellar protein FlaJ
VRTGKTKIKLRNPFSKKNAGDPSSDDNEHVIEGDKASAVVIQAEGVDTQEPDGKKVAKGSTFSFLKFGKKKANVKSEENGEYDEVSVRGRNTFEKTAYSALSNHLPGFEEFRQTYAQSGIPIVFEAYISTGFLLSFVAAIPTFVVSLLLELKLFPHGLVLVSILGSLILSAVALAISLVLWLSYPLMRRRSFKSKLENQLAYSFGILGVLAAGGMNLDRLFERIASSESNPVMSDLAKRLLRNIRVFGMDTDSALNEVAQHSPSEAFSKMLGSIAVAHKTTGSIHDLVMFESSRLLQEKRDKLRKTTGSLAVMAELYITVVVVGPIIFIVMMAIFGLLPAGGLPNPISIINLLVFIGVPVLSVMFVLLLDSVVSKA